MAWIILATAWYFIGMLCFYRFADWSETDWVNGYYLWDKCKDLIFSGVITYLTVYGKYFKIIFFFSIIRFLWEVLAIVVSQDINNSRVIDALFMGFLLIWIIQTLKEARQWRKK